MSNRKRKRSNFRKPRGIIRSAWLGAMTGSNCGCQSCRLFAW